MVRRTVSIQNIKTYLLAETRLNKPSRGVSRCKTVFLAKKLSKYRHKPPKCRVRGTTKKPEKTQLIIQPEKPLTFMFKRVSKTQSQEKVGHNQVKKSRTPDCEPFEGQNDLFLTIFGQNQANQRMERNQKFQLPLY